MANKAQSGPQTFPAESYRRLVLVGHPASELEKQWNRVCADDPSYWERLEIRDRVIELKMEGGPSLRLAPIGAKDLPALAASATPVGRWLARRSLFARILSSRVGKEEVTFYALLNQAHGDGFDRWLDRRLLNIGHAPLCYRRQKVVEFIRRSLLELVREGKTHLGFLDIGCGGGFDGLDVHRICAALPGVQCRVVNVDIDEQWLAQNRTIAAAVGAGSIARHHVSVFDYLQSQTHRQDFAGVSDLIVSCNGFADFFPDQALRELLDGLRQLLQQVPGRVRFVFAAALQRNRVQTFLSNLVGFTYQGRTSAAIRGLLGSALGGFDLRFEEAHSQIICLVRRD